MNLKIYILEKKKPPHFQSSIVIIWNYSAFLNGITNYLVGQVLLFSFFKDCWKIASFSKEHIKLKL